MPVVCFRFYCRRSVSCLISYFRLQAGLRTLHGLGPQLRRAISGQLGSDDDELFLKEDDSQKAQVNSKVQRDFPFCLLSMHVEIEWISC